MLKGRDNREYSNQEFEKASLQRRRRHENEYEEKGAFLLGVACLLAEGCLLEDMFLHPDSTINSFRESFVCNQVVYIVLSYAR